MGLRNASKRFVRKRSDQLSAWAGDDPWIWNLEDDGSGTEMMHLLRRRPVRFEDIDKVERLFDQLRRDTSVSAVWITADGAGIAFGRNSTDQIERRQILEEIAAGPPTDRRTLNIAGGDATDRPDWTLALSTERMGAYRGKYGAIQRMRPLEEAPIPVSGEIGLHTVRQVARAVERHVIEMTPREARKNPALFSPLGARDAAQQEHDRAVSDRASRKAAIWGLAAGVVSGIGGGLIARLLGS